MTRQKLSQGMIYLGGFGGFMTIVGYFLHFNIHILQALVYTGSHLVLIGIFLSDKSRKNPDAPRSQRK